MCSGKGRSGDRLEVETYGAGRRARGISSVMRKGTAPHEPPQWRRVLGDLFTVNNDAPWRWRPGLEAALATALPLGILTAAGYQSLGLIASLGTFTALRARTPASGAVQNAAPHRRRHDRRQP